MKTSKKAYAKINLSLEISNRRSDGYHNILSVMQKVALHDTLYFEPNESGEIFVSCDKSVCGMTDNLAYKAAIEYKRRFYERCKKSFGLTIEIKKQIPDKAGLAGGSADCACVLDYLYENVGVVTYEEVEKIAASLGSDINFCLDKYRCALCSDRGIDVEKLSPYKNGIVVIAKPDVGLKTSEVYGEFDKNPILFDDNPSLEIKRLLNSGCENELAPFVKNAFTPICVSLCREIGVLLEKMRSCSPLFCEMSGSGTSVFGFFESKVDAQKACDLLSGEYDTFLTQTLDE